MILQITCHQILRALAALWIEPENGIENNNIKLICLPFPVDNFLSYFKSADVSELLFKDRLLKNHNTTKR